MEAINLVQQAANLNGIALVGVLDRALRSPNVYYFSELLNLPNVKALASTEHANKVSLLELLAYGTYADYKASQTTYGPLADVLLTKLKQLSIVSMASTKKILPYTEIQQQLDIPNSDDIEPLLISCIYSGLIVGTLDQRTSSCYISSTIGRDVTNDQLDDLLTVLRKWQNNVTDTLAVLDQQMEAINTTKEKQSKEEKAFQTKLKDNLKAMEHRSGGSGGYRSMKGDVGENLVDQLSMEAFLQQSSTTAGRPDSSSTGSNGPYSEIELNRMLLPNDGTDLNRQVKRERRNDPSLEQSSSSVGGSQSGSEIFRKDSMETE